MMANWEDRDLGRSGKVAREQEGRVLVGWVTEVKGAEETGCERGVRIGT